MPPPQFKSCAALEVFDQATGMRRTYLLPFKAGHVFVFEDSKAMSASSIIFRLEMRRAFPGTVSLRQKVIWKASASPSKTLSSEGVEVAGADWVGGVGRGGDRKGC